MATGLLGNVVLEGITLDSASLITLVQEVDEIRTLEGLEDDPFNKAELKYREVAEELRENLEKTSIPGLNELTDRLIADMDEYDEAGSCDDLPVCMSAIANLLEETISECKDQSVKRKVPGEDDVSFLVAGSKADIRLRITLNEPKRSAAVNNDVKEIMESVRGFVVQKVMYYCDTEDDVPADHLLEDAEIMYPSTSGTDIIYTFNVTVNVNSDVPENGVADHLYNKVDEYGYDVYSLSIKPGQSAILGNNGLKPEQLFFADKAVIESQKQALLATDADGERSYTYNIRIRLWLNNVWLDGRGKHYDTNEVDEAAEYICDGLSASLSKAVEHTEVQKIYDEDTGKWSVKRLPITDSKAPFFQMHNGLERYYEATFEIQAPKAEEIEDIQYIVENALELSGEGGELPGYEIEVNGYVYVPDGYGKQRLQSAKNAIWDVLEDKLDSILPPGDGSEILLVLDDYIAHYVFDTWEYRNEGMKITEKNIFAGLVSGIKAAEEGIEKEIKWYEEREKADPYYFMPES